VKHTSHRSKRSGFTLIELMVVLLIIGLLAGLVGVRVLDRLGEAKITKAKAQITMLHEAVKHYRLDTGQYPDPSIGLDALVQEPAGVNGWHGPYIESSEIPLDPWDNYYMYDYPGDRYDYDIYSYGADGREGGEEENADVYNTERTQQADQEEMY